MLANERALDGTIIKWRLNEIRPVDGKKNARNSKMFSEKATGHV
jgi:hypothetical protein